MTTVPRGAIVTDEAALRALAPDWWALWRRCPAATPFASPAWLLPWWRCFAPGALRVATVRAGGVLVGLAPLYREEGPHGCRLLPLGISLSDYLDCLLDPAHAAGAAAALADLLAGERVHWEALAPDACALTLPRRPGTRDGVERQDSCPVLDLSRPLPSGKRRKLAMARHRVERRSGRIDLATPNTAPAFLEQLIGLHGARWATRGEAGVLVDARVRAFHALAVPRLAEAGLLRFSALRVEDRVAGVYYGFAHGTRAYAYLGGFDPLFARESPGTVLLGHALDRARAEGAREFHFLRGQEAYKYEWGALDRWNSRRTVEPDA